MPLSTLQVALPVPLPGCFDYSLPPEMPVPPRGARVEVPFGKRTLVGVVHAHQPSSLKTLKAVKRVLDEAPIIDERLYALCEWAAGYYHHPLGEVLNFVLPTLLRQGQAARPDAEIRWRITDRGRHVTADRLKRAPRQQEALALLAEHPDGLTPAMLEALSVSRPALQALREKQWAEREEHLPQVPPLPADVLAEPALSASPEQRLAIEAINQASGFQPFLLDGVTGSGKTEVYLQAMAPVLAAGRQVLVLVPEIGLTPQTLRRFRQRFAVPVTVMHSGLNDRERLEAWLAAGEGRARIIIGTRSAIFTPLHAPGLIIVDEAHDGSLKQQDGFRYHARDLATWRARQWNIPVVHGSATPALETLHLAHTDRYQWLRLRERAGGAALPDIELLDARGAAPDAPLLPSALTAIEDTVRRGEQALVFLNRRGFAPVILCRDCGWQAECPRCDSVMTWHRSLSQLRCHHCDHQQRVPRRCPECGSSNLIDAGAGTEKLEALLSDHCKAPVVRIDRDTTRRKGSLDAKLAEIRGGAPAVLVGTQMLAKGHHFPRLSLVVITNLDAGFLSADFRGPEQAAQLLLQVAGRAGRKDLRGRVLLQSRHTDHHLVRLAAAGDYHALADTLLEERRMAGLPPFGHLALLRCEAMSMDKALAFLDECAAPFQQNSNVDDDSVNLLGPAPAPMEKRAGRYRAQLLLQAPQRPALHGVLDALVRHARGLPSARHCRWHVDVDPTEMV